MLAPPPTTTTADVGDPATSSTFLVTKLHAWRGRYHRLLTLQQGSAVTTWTTDGATMTNSWPADGLIGLEVRFFGASELRVTLHLRQKPLWFGITPIEELRFGVSTQSPHTHRLCAALNQMMLPVVAETPSINGAGEHQVEPLAAIDDVADEIIVAAIADEVVTPIVAAAMVENGKVSLEEEEEGGAGVEPDASPAPTARAQQAEAEAAPTAVADATEAEAAPTVVAAATPVASAPPRSGGRSIRRTRPFWELQQEKKKEEEERMRRQREAAEEEDDVTSATTPTEGKDPAAPSPLLISPPNLMEGAEDTPAEIRRRPDEEYWEGLVRSPPVARAMMSPASSTMTSPLPQPVTTPMVIEALAELRESACGDEAAAQATATAKQLHEQLSRRDGFRAVPLPTVRKAKSKLAKRDAKQAAAAAAVKSATAGAADSDAEGGAGKENEPAAADVSWSAAAAALFTRW